MGVCASPRIRVGMDNFALSELMGMPEQGDAPVIAYEKQQ